MREKNSLMQISQHVQVGHANSLRSPTESSLVYIDFCVSSALYITTPLTTDKGNVFVFKGFPNFQKCDCYLTQPHVV